MKLEKISSIIISFLIISSCTGSGNKQIPGLVNTDTEEFISLHGEWGLALDPNKAIGHSPLYPNLLFSDELSLPGTLTENQKGIPNNDRSVWKNLSREYMFEGTAYYKRIIEIPSGWSGKRIVLRMERTRKTAVWLDGKLLGSDLHLCTSQVYELGEVDPGEHELVVAVDNVVKSHPAGSSHMNTEATQTNWNGILGRIQLESTPEVWISRVRIFPDLESKQAVVELTLNNGPGGKQKGEIRIESRSFNTSTVHEPGTVSFEFALSKPVKTIRSLIEFGDEILLWDEFDPALYRARIIMELEDGQIQHLERTFGMRSFTQNGSQFLINGNTTFLRGKHDACVFPLTGYAPMDVEEWLRILNIARDYGINHYRFHTWCPPEAALAAADLLGIYMQPELPSWGELDAQERGVSFKDINAVAFGSEISGKGKTYDPVIQTAAEEFFRKEAEEILDDYGNYASFVMFAIGNELKGNRMVMKRLVDGFREYDNNRRLYSQGSNNYFRDPRKGETDDYFTTVRTSTKTWKEYGNNTRISFSRADQYDGGLVNMRKPSTRVNFSEAIEPVDVPVIGHETGQYCYYPDYTELAKYTGITRPWNLELGKEILREKGMMDMAPEFFKAAGRWASILYCEDMESGIRTPGFGGFQLLDLQDFPGQGTALVGPLNAFMESKGTISPERWGQFCAPVTLLAEFDEYTLTGGETFVADIRVANYGNKKLGGSLTWTIEGIGSGEFNTIAPQGQITNAGQLIVELPGISKAIRVNLVLEHKGTDLVKSYPLWIYPAPEKLKLPEDVLVTGNMDSKALHYLEEGGRVLFIPAHDASMENSVGGLFMTEFWSYRMFYTISVNRGVEPSPGTLGLLIDNDHRALKGFPTEFHSNWQWWSAVKNSRPLILDEAPAGYRPLVQTIDNMWRSHKLGTLFEFRVGKGRLLVSAIDLPAIKHTPEGNALYKSILDYMGSGEFNPPVKITPEELHRILG